MAALTGLYKASPEYAEKMRLQGLNKREQYERALFDQSVRLIESDEYYVQRADINKAMTRYANIGSTLEEQGRFEEAYQHKIGEGAIAAELMSFMAQQSTNSIETQRAVKSSQEDMTSNLREFYRSIRLGGDK